MSLASWPGAITPILTAISTVRRFAGSGCTSANTPVTAGYSKMAKRLIEFLIAIS